MSGGGQETLLAISGAPLVVQGDDGRYYQIVVRSQGSPKVDAIDLGTEPPGGCVVCAPEPVE